MTISIKNVSVTFPGIKALSEVGLTFNKGRIHAVLGANGSGKSTLVKVLTGVYKPDAGAAIRIEGEEYAAIEDPNMSLKLGIKVVHQEAPLIDSLSVAENVALFKGYPLKKNNMINWSLLHAQARELMDFYGIEVDAKSYVRDLTASERSMVAIAITLGDAESISETKAFILDEADASIPEDDAEKFLKRVRLIADLDIPVIMVTHRMREVEAYCDDVSILNDGKVVFTGEMKDIDQDFIIRHMLKAGTEGIEQDVSVTALWEIADKRPPEKTADAALVVEGLTGETLNELTFSVSPGEIVGIAGIADSGVSELPLILGGAINRKSGTYAIAGKALPRKLTPRKVIREGIALVPSDRLRQGGVMTRSLRDNMLLPNEPKYFGRKKLAYETTEKAVEVLDIRPDAPDMRFGKFSGGNQQKSIVAKWLLMCPRVLVLDDPTYGVDPTARLKIFASIRDSADNGVAVVVFSTEPEQLVLLCTKVLVLRKGQVVTELKREDGSLTRESIARWCYA
jgi:ribose transport system ATP-binding protein